MKAGFVWLTIIAVLNSVIAVYYYLRLVVVMYMREPAEEAVFQASWGWAYAFAALVLTVASTLNLGIFPASFMDFAQRSLVLLN